MQYCVKNLSSGTQVDSFRDMALRRYRNGPNGCRGILKIEGILLYFGTFCHFYRLLWLTFFEDLMKLNIV